MLDPKKNVPSLLLVLVAGAAAVLLSSGRLRFSAAADEAAPAEEESRSHVVDGRVVLDEEALRLSGIRTAEAEKGSVAVTLPVNGEVRLAEGRWARVTPRISGVVRTLSASTGRSVGVGAALATVESTELGEGKSAYAQAIAERDVATKNLERWTAGERSEFEAKGPAAESAGWVDLDQAVADHDAAVADAALADRSLARVKDLVERGLKTQSDLWTAEQEAARAKIKVDSAHRRLAVLGVVAQNEVRATELRVAAAASRLRTLGLAPAEVAALLSGDGARPDGVYEVRSPVAGVVLERAATIGESVEAKDTLFVIGDLSVVWVRAALYEKDLARVREGAPASVHLQAFPGASFAGRLVRVGRQVDEKTRTVLLDVEVENRAPAGIDVAEPMRPGMFATASIELARETDVVVVPREAVHRMGGDTVVFVRSAATSKEGAQAGKDGGATFEPRVVVLGAADDANVRIVRGVEAGETIAVENAYLLKSELTKSQFAEEE